MDKTRTTQQWRLETMSNVQPGNDTSIEGCTAEHTNCHADRKTTSRRKLAGDHHRLQQKHGEEWM